MENSHQTSCQKDTDSLKTVCRNFQICRRILQTVGEKLFFGFGLSDFFPVFVAIDRLSVFISC